MTPREFLDCYRNGDPVVLIDVRNSDEFEAVRAEPAFNVPLSLLDPHAVMEQLKEQGLAGARVCIICQSGPRAAAARERFVGAGYDSIELVEGGTVGWVRQGLPFLRGTSPSQVRHSGR